MDDVKTQWSTVKPYLAKAEVEAMTWLPEDERLRVASYLQYDDMYWNDPRQFALRVLEGEEPVYIPNARMVVNTTAHYLLKGLQITCENKETNKYLEDFLKREEFYTRFEQAKISGVTRGDWIFHLTADPTKAPGKRISLTAVQPMDVFPIWDEDIPDKMVGVHIVQNYIPPKETDPDQKVRMHRLTYRYVVKKNKRRIERSEGIWTIEGRSWLSGEAGKARLIRTILKPTLLDERIETLPIYWFKNQAWGGDDYGSSELRGIERLIEVISQGATDVSGALALEGLGVYATDGGRPVEEDPSGQMVEADWEVAPGKVMEVPAGSYFRRVQGVGSVTPAIDNIDYLESSIQKALGLSDVALGQVDAQVAQSGIALAIKFMPTLARIEPRDRAGIDKLTQLFYDWKTWVEVFERKVLDGDIVPAIGDKLPQDRVARINELNNMRDRKLISGQYYRDEMEKLGYTFPADIQKQIDDEAEKAFQDQMRAMIEAANLAAKNKSNDDKTSTQSDSEEGASGNRSNNRNRVNESNGTEATTDA